MQRIYGRKSVLETIDSKQKILRAFILKNKNQENTHNILGKIVKKLKDKDIPIEFVDKSFFENVDGNHQGVMIEIEDFVYKSLSSIMDKERVILLDEIEDPHNLGAIIRSAEAFGFGAVIITERRSAKVNSTVYKTSAGAINNIDLVMVKNLNRAIKALKENNFWIYGLAGEAESSLGQTDLRGKIGLVVGNEGSGLSRLVRENCDGLIKIPMLGQINSLNASVAAGLAIYEVSRQNGFK
ncbi:MAG: 23S rRNA (guanosine(2251)-2'-O)-methyltransferase RlmB [Peptoniphilaceae bacterium]|nr:23S rRNA (guanosine(2251)-2'-O)-methyltransferase RlmB [Peptoniphilaceae bacterium]MDY6018063.1 23S rRNA (guanosine(2251)-2'-O)-methyltransferase RlmB [Anaerococcus sp.]